MEDKKKFMIMNKNKINLIENEYSFYKSDILSINNIIDTKIEKINFVFRINKVDSNYLGKVRYNKQTSKIEFFNCFDEIEGNLLISRGITEDKFIYINDIYKSDFQSICCSAKSIELFCLIDRYFYSKNKNVETNSKYYSRFTVLYGDTINQESLEIKEKNTYLDINLINNIRNLFDNEKLLALEYINNIQILNLDLNIKFIESGKNNKNKDDECVICLDMLGKKYTKLQCKHRFHISCLNDWINANKTEDDNNDNKLLIKCPLCRKETNAVNSVNFLDSKLPTIKDGKALLDFSPIISKEISQKNIQLVDFLGNTGFKMVKINENSYSIEYNDNISSKLNNKISKILAMINIIS